MAIQWEDIEAEEAKQLDGFREEAYAYLEGVGLSRELTDEIVRRVHKYFGLIDGKDHLLNEVQVLKSCAPISQLNDRCLYFRLFMDEKAYDRLWWMARIGRPYLSTGMQWGFLPLPQ